MRALAEAAIKHAKAGDWRWFREVIDRVDGPIAGRADVRDGADGPASVTTIDELHIHEMDLAMIRAMHRPIAPGLPCALGMLPATSERKPALRDGEDAESVEET